MERETEQSEKQRDVARSFSLGKSHCLGQFCPGGELETTSV